MRFITYDLTIGDTLAWAAATQVADGLFVTVEFHTAGPESPQDVFGTAIDACLATLQMEP